MSTKKKVTLSEDLQQCSTVLKFLQGKEEADPFLVPVDWKELDLPDYPEVVKNPMDLGTVETKLNTGKYADAEEFAEDVRLVWKNAMAYNRADSEIYKTAEELSNLFEKRFVKIKKTETPKRKKPDTKSEVKETNRADRIKFSVLVNQLNSEQLGYVVGVIQRQCPGALNDDNEDEIEIEISKLEATTLLELNTYASECAQTNGATKKKKK